MYSPERQTKPTKLKLHVSGFEILLHVNRYAGTFEYNGLLRRPQTRDFGVFGIVNGCTRKKGWDKCLHFTPFLTNQPKCVSFLHFKVHKNTPMFYLEPNNSVLNTITGSTFSYILFFIKIRILIKNLLNEIFFFPNFRKRREDGLCMNNSSFVNLV